ncbi:hypothetical protein EPUL_000462, partial [Erysiphe pulchra]
MSLRVRQELAPSIRTSYLRMITTSSVKPISSVLIANRGEIAIRVGRTASKLGIRCTTIYTESDLKSQHALHSAFNANLGHSSAYLDGEKIISIAKKRGCEALHPGYGFLSENSEFARRCFEEGLVFIGPSWESIEMMGNKSRSKEIMIKACVPCIPGYHGPNQDQSFLLDEAKKIGFPVMVKAVKGGGGKGMRVVTREDEFLDKLSSAKSEGINSFGDDAMLVEKYISSPRHIEVQIFGDRYGNVVALGERDCSIQRRHQKILEESPAPNLAEDIRKDLWDKAKAAAVAVKYQGAGTVEFMYDNDTKNFYFMEMNTRLQVEHPVTEVVTGEDLVEWQFKVAAGEPLPLDQITISKRFKSRGWAIESRIYAENPDNNFMPDSGKLRYLKIPKIGENVRIDAGFVEGDTISPAYDGMLAKLIVSASTRRLAIKRLHSALQEYEIVGVSTNIEFLKKICQSQAFVEGEVNTSFIQEHKDQIFTPSLIAPEVYVQAAIALLRYSSSKAVVNLSGPHGLNVGFKNFNEREINLLTVEGKNKNLIKITLKSIEKNRYTFELNINGTEKVFKDVFFECKDLSISSFFSHTRIDSTVVLHDDIITVFQKGQKIVLKIASPDWINKILDCKDSSSSVFAPMPCKILRLIAREGDSVHENDPLIVKSSHLCFGNLTQTEVFRMETIIRSPQNGVISKLIHKEG